MPQLNPAPWFITFLTSWLIISTMLTPKLNAHLPNEPNKNANELTTSPWHWPWY
uniref:ATP synthase complex subunit 8 n=1 Tax=Aprasia parapulchella TaxID=207572 RepID=A0A067Z5V0_9SAUR|nr:ATP synthase F0 subunit 8 [Aprasia parapulchella]AHL17037.1 ATP synthase F0 subunit 8 [Aprasia parapulchella]